MQSYQWSTRTTLFRSCRKALDRVRGRDDRVKGSNVDGSVIGDVCMILGVSDTHMHVAPQ